eukprot:gene5749-6452_t
MLTVVGGIMMLKFSFHGQTASNMTMKYLIRYLSLFNLLVGITAMPCNVAVMLCDRVTCSNVACLARYIFTFIFSNNSLMILSILCHYRRDLIVKAPFGKYPFVKPNNRKKIIVFSTLVSFVPNLALSTGYAYLMIHSHIPPCEPSGKLKTTTHYYLGIIEGIKTGVLFAVCFTSIIRDVSSIRKTLAEQSEKIEQSAVRARQSAKVNANLYFAVVFIVMWVPFSFIAAFANYIPVQYYKDVFTIGYTLAYGSFAALPICYALTDGNFKAYTKRVLRIKTTTTTTTTVHPVNPI